MALESFCLTEDEAIAVAKIRTKIDCILEEMSIAQRKYRTIKSDIFSSRNIKQEDSECFLINDNVALFVKK